MKHIALITLLLSTPAIASYASWYGNQFHGRLTVRQYSHHSHLHKLLAIMMIYRFKEWI